MTTPPCIFCKIIAGDIPCHRLYEDDRILAFLDVGPLSKGHALVIPKTHYQTLDELPSEDAAAIGRILPALARAIAKATGSAAYNILQNNGTDAGQVVPHVHFHIIPRKPGTNRKDATHGNGLPSGGWPASEADHAATKELMGRINILIATELQ